MVQEATPETRRSRKRSSDSPPSICDSPSKAKKLRTTLKATARSDSSSAQKTLERLSDTVSGLSAKLMLSNLKVKHLNEALSNENKKKKRKRNIAEEIMMSDGSGTLFMSPSRIQEARDIVSGREQEREQALRGKELRAEERAREKVQKKTEAVRKRDERAVAAAARKTAANEKKAAVQRAREARQAHKESALALQATTRRPRGPPKKQAVAESPSSGSQRLTNVEPVQHLMTGKGQPVRRPARFSTQDNDQTVIQRPKFGLHVLYLYRGSIA